MGFKIIQLGTPTPFPPLPGLPIILFTDVLTGPLSGGENNKGCYLSIYGYSFGNSFGMGSTTKVFIGGIEVDNYRLIEPAAASVKFVGLQKLVVQVGALGGAALDVPLDIVVELNSTPSNSNHTFTPCAGNVYFVDLFGDDTDADANSGTIDHPYRHLQTYIPGPETRAGAYGVIGAGDHVVIRGGAWNDTAFEGGWLRFRDAHAMGLANAWIHFTSYPGETVTYTTPTNMKGGFQGPGSAYAGTCGEYISMSNLNMIVGADAAGDAAPFNQQYGEGPWRVVNNDIGPWLSTEDARAGGYSGGGQGTKVLGCYIHDIRRICDSVNVGTQEFIDNCPGGAVGGGESLLNHGMYVDGGATDFEGAYNAVVNVREGNLFQSYNSNGLPIFGLSLHHNWFETAGKFGINISGGTYSGAIFCNVVKDAHHSGWTLNVAGDGSPSSPVMDLILAYNTFINCDKSRTYGQLLNQWGNYFTNGYGTVVISNNICFTNDGAPSTFYANSGDSDAYMAWGTNLFYDGNGAPVGGGGTIINADPLFTDIIAGDYSLLPGSPAHDAAVAIAGFTLTTDLFSHTRPLGAAADIGAIEYVE